jgi:hypothetical protein
MEQSDLFVQLSERVAVLETNQSADRITLQSIEGKLDSLLELKAKGMGAFWLISLVIGSGVLGLVAFVTNMFSRPHL